MCPSQLRDEYDTNMCVCLPFADDVFNQ
uniref:Uncharacterized protein n=1 Tax=Arundo donax TaxID=35708 RepID=A0A0A8ZTY1_ARUDO